MEHEKLKQFFLFLNIFLFFYFREQKIIFENSSTDALNQIMDFKSDFTSLKYLQNGYLI